MPWYEITGAVIAVLAIIFAIVKNDKAKKIIQGLQVTVGEAHTALDDGKITKTEFVTIVTTAITQFLP